jgi:hypothetical protein
MAYTTIDDPTLYFSSTIWTGNGVDDRAIVIDGTGMQPDFVWIKSRNDTDNHRLVDSVRGATKHIESDNTSAEQTSSNVKTFTSTGVTLSTNGSVNANTELYASWAWKAGGTASSNTDGSITSSVSANTTAGFSIVSYTGNGTAGATVGHGLSSKPGMMIFKERNGVTGWVVYHHKNTSAPATEYLQLDNTNATEDYADYFNDTEPTSSVFTLGNDTGINQNTDTYIAYCFAEKQGFSKFGSYTGNGSADGPFIYTGFKPAFFMVKGSSFAGENWDMLDNKRNTFNTADSKLSADSSAAESTNSVYNNDFLSNGFKLRNK